MQSGVASNWRSATSGVASRGAASVAASSIAPPPADPPLPVEPPLPVKPPRPAEPAAPAVPAVPGEPPVAPLPAAPDEPTVPVAPPLALPDDPPVPPAPPPVPLDPPLPLLPPCPGEASAGSAVPSAVEDSHAEAASRIKPKTSRAARSQAGRRPRRVIQPSVAKDICTDLRVVIEKHVAVFADVGIPAEGVATVPLLVGIFRVD